MIPILPVLLCALTLATPVFAQTAIDGDTIKLDGTTYRLWGIDAPESKQACGGWLRRFAWFTERTAVPLH